MARVLFAPGPCAVCGERLVPAELNLAFRTSDPILPHFQCTGCRAIFSMNEDFELTECETLQHIHPLPARNLEADARLLRERYYRASKPARLPRATPPGDAA